MSELRKVLVIARVELRRLFRDRTNIFFVLIFPIVLVLAIGTVFGEDRKPGLGVVAPNDDPLAEEVVAQLRDSDEVDLHEYDSESGMRDAVERGSLRAGVVLPADYGRQLRAGDTSDVEFLAGPTGIGMSLRSVVEAAIRTQAIDVQAAQFAAAHGAPGFDAALDTARRLDAELPPVEVEVRTLGEAMFGEDLGQFDVGASSQLVLFMFVTGLAGSAQLIMTRRLGVARRMLSTPTASSVTLLGEAAGRFVITAFQGAYIMVFTLLLFGVDWGDPLGAVAVLVLFALVATGAAMLAGAVFRTDQQAGSVGVMFGLGLAALGGCMAPLEVFPPTMRTIAHLTPHAWALDAYDELVDDHGTLVDILPNLGVLALFAAVLLALGINRFRHTITTG